MLKKNLDCQSQKGFTLTEVLVTMAIFVMLTTIVVVEFTSTDAYAELIEAESTTLATVKQARNDSVTITEFQSGIFPSYGVYFEKGSSELVVFADCVTDDSGNGGIGEEDNFTYNPSGTGCAGGNGFVRSVDLPGQVTISEIYYDADWQDTNLGELVDKAYIEYIRPLPQIWMTVATGTTAVVPYGNIKIELTTERNESLSRLVTFWLSGLVESGKGE